jgi:hypothetical protein
MLQDGRIRTFPRVLHILGLERNIISVNKMSDACLKTLFYKDSCKMAREVMVLMRDFGLESYTSFWEYQFN